MLQSWWISPTAGRPEGSQKILRMTQVQYGEEPLSSAKYGCVQRQVPYYKVKIHAVDKSLDPRVA